VLIFNRWVVFIFTIPLESLELLEITCIFGDFGIGDRSNNYSSFFILKQPIYKYFFLRLFYLLFGVGFFFLLELGSVTILLQVPGEEYKFLELFVVGFIMVN